MFGQLPHARGGSRYFRVLIDSYVGATLLQSPPHVYQLIDTSKPPLVKPLYLETLTAWSLCHPRNNVSRNAAMAFCRFLHAA